MQTTNNPIAHDPVLKEIYIKAMNILSRRDYSQRELTEKLLEKGYPEDAIATVMDYLLQKGYVDDARYADRLVEKAKNLYGKQRIKQILYQHKLDAEVIQQALSELDDSAADEDILLKLKRQFRGNPIPEELIQKTVAKFMRQGYAFEPIRNAMLRYTEEIEETNI